MISIEFVNYNIISSYNHTSLQHFTQSKLPKNFHTYTKMRPSLLSISSLLALPLTTLADFHYGYSDYTITTATGRYAMILPASQTNCTEAYDFYPKGPFGFEVPTGQVKGMLFSFQILLSSFAHSFSYFPNLQTSSRRKNDRN